MSPPDETSLFRIVKHPMGHGIKAIWVSQFSATKFNFFLQSTTENIYLSKIFYRDLGIIVFLNMYNRFKSLLK